MYTYLGDLNDSAINKLGEVDWTISNQNSSWKWSFSILHNMVSNTSLCTNNNYIWFRSYINFSLKWHQTIKVNIYVHGIKYKLLIPVCSVDGVWLWSFNPKVNLNYKCKTIYSLPIYINRRNLLFKTTSLISWGRM
jgi:hypothetical protein